LRGALAVLLVVAAASSARAAQTTMVPRGVWILDVSYLDTRLDARYSNEGSRESLLPSQERYEPGGGLQGVLHARPEVSFQFVITQLAYGVTEDLTAALLVPLVLRTRVATHLGWEPGDYQPQLGRSYSEADFWAWAGSMGQPRPADDWEGNRYALSDLVLAARYRVPRWAFLEKTGILATVGLQVALPTGRPPDREELVTVGTTSWDLHSYGDVELHAAASRSVWTDGAGVDRLHLTVDGFFSWFRPRSFETPRGELNPLLMNFAPYVGDSYTIDPGDWLGATVTLEAALVEGPSARGFIHKSPPAPGGDLPPLLSLALSHTHLRTGQSDWRSDSPLWDWEQEKYWRPGFKNILAGTATLSLLRMGWPLQMYVSARDQSLLAGKNIRPSDVLTGGARLFAAF
jgi:hypothetical protein